MKTDEQTNAPPPLAPLRAYNPDVLSCIANLSNDEVFTPPELANRMLDMLPQKLFSDPSATFLDPACKSGVFLREIAKRLIKGLEREIPNLQTRLDHIFRKQLFGLAITELTSLLSRRSLYCSKFPNGKYSVVRFRDEQGNIHFGRVEHEWENGKCRFCGASQSQWDRGDALESHAYSFIHADNPEEFFNMKFDVIISNPPYQLNVGVEKENYAIAIYDRFVTRALKLNPRYCSMVIPARWYAGGRNLDLFRDAMLHDNRLKVLVDYPDAAKVFPGVDISGGICYFLWASDYRGDCEVKNIIDENTSNSMCRPLLEKGADSFIRFNTAIPILRKIQAQRELSFASLVSPQTPFGFVSSFSDYRKTAFRDSVIIHTVGGIGYVDKAKIRKGNDLVSGHKVYIAKSYGERGSYPYYFLAKPFLGEPNSCCTQTYLCIGTFKTKKEAENVMSYIRTRFFRFCVMLKRNTQDAMRHVYSFVPMQDFSKPWTDEELYRKYKLEPDEIAFIESMIKPME